jgi:nucleoside phosphorylase
MARADDILVVAATELELRVVRGSARTLCCGIGPVEAAAHTAAALARDAAAGVLQIGVAGATRESSVAVGALVVGEEAVYEDISGDLAARVPRVERLAPDPRLLAAARDALPGAAVLPIGTTAFVGAGRACQVEAMEGFAVLRACELTGVPALEVRAISNRVDDPRAEWRLEEALTALEEALPLLLDAAAAALPVRG